MNPTPDEVRATSRTLAWIRSYDANFPRADEAMTLAWSRAFAHHGLTWPDLETGVDRFFADANRPRDRVLPADIIRTAREARRQRAEREKITGDIDRATLTPARQAIHDCTDCDPNGFIEGPDGRLHRCQHNRKLEQ